MDSHDHYRYMIVLFRLLCLALPCLALHRSALLRLLNAPCLCVGEIFLFVRSPLLRFVRESKVTLSTVLL
jgi:hypothetical protein